MKPVHLVISAGILAAAFVFLALVITAPHEPERPMVYVIYGSEKGDLSYTDSAYRGLFTAQETMSFAKREFVSLDRDHLTALFKSPGREKPGLVITVGYNYAGDTRELAKENPDIRFLAIDQAGIGSPNLKAYEITSYGESYLAGVLAASATKTRNVGILLGTKSELLEGFRQGYIDGIHAVDPSIRVQQEYVRENTTGGFSDPARGREIAGSMYQQGADVIYTVAGFSGTGAITEARAAPGRYIIGVDTDQTYLGPSVVLASAVKRVDRVVYTGIEEYLDGSFSGGDHVAGLDEGVTGLSFNPKFASYNQTVGAWEEKAREEEARYLASRKP